MPKQRQDNRDNSRHVARHLAGWSCIRCDKNSWGVVKLKSLIHVNYLSTNINWTPKSITTTYSQDAQPENSSSPQPYTTPISNEIWTAIAESMMNEFLLPAPYYCPTRESITTITTELSIPMTINRPSCSLAALSADYYWQRGFRYKCRWLTKGALWYPHIF